MRVLFVTYASLDSNVGIQIFNLVNHLTLLGVECSVCVPRQGGTSLTDVEPLFKVFDVEDARRAATGRRVDLIHAWTPREKVRRMTSELLAIYSCPYVVHLEDNEEFLLRARGTFPVPILQYVPFFLLDRLTRGSIVHPRRYKEFLAGARGITIIVDALRKYCPERARVELTGAGYQEDMQWDMPRDLELRRELGIAATEFVVLYPGNVHVANRQEVASLYLAVELLQTRGLPIKLVRTGSDPVHPLGPWANARKHNYSLELGWVARSRMPFLFSISDALVQPGVPGPFNDYRLPAKLPECLASGKPVVLPRANLGLLLKDGEECLLLGEGGASDIARKLELLFSDEILRKKIGSGGRRFAEQNLRWSSIASRLYSFYRALLE